jgi:hypothetical protein
VHRRDFFIAATITRVATAGLDAGPASAKAQAPQVKPAAEDRRAMGEVIAVMRKAAVVDKTGGPFGAVVMRGSEILSAVGFDLERLYATRSVPVSQMMRADARTVWNAYRKLPEKTRY